jgi:hypothetical protein
MTELTKEEFDVAITCGVMTFAWLEGEEKAENESTKVVKAVIEKLFTMRGERFPNGTE